MRYESLSPLMRWVVYFYVIYYLITKILKIYETLP